MGGLRRHSAQFKVAPIVMNSRISLLIFEIADFLIHRMRMLLMQRIALVLALAISIVLPAEGLAQDALRSDHALYFAAGWRVNEPSPQNMLQLGIVFRCGAAWCMEYEEFSGRDNLPRSPLPYRHEMAAPYGNHRCTDEHLTTIHGGAHNDLLARVTDNDRGFVLLVGSYEYTWERDTSPVGGFVLVKARGSDHDAVLSSLSDSPMNLRTRQGGRFDPAT
jgi:hypothetical protein